MEIKTGTVVRLTGSRKQWLVRHDYQDGRFLVQWSQGNGRRCESRTVTQADVRV